MEQALVKTSGALMPAMSIVDAVDRYNQFNEFVRRVMKSGVDFGVVPGTDKKPTLFKPGAEKLATLFNLSHRLNLLSAVEDWTGEQHGGEPFFYYRYQCVLLHGGVIVGETEGSCNSWEKKYRYRAGERTCPTCGKTAIIKGKAEYGGGWLCWKNKGGCGDKWVDGDLIIEGQSVEKIINPDVCDLVNTIQKMAQKRAYVGAVLTTTNASEYFTQDVEDIYIDGQFSTVPHDADDKATPAPAPSQPKTSRAKATAPKTSDKPTSPIKRKLPTISTPKWSSMLDHIAAFLPHYANDAGAANPIHILNALANEGWTEITDANLDQVMTVLRRRVEEKESAQLEPAATV